MSDQPTDAVSPATHARSAEHGVGEAPVSGAATVDIWSIAPPVSSDAADAPESLRDEVDSPSLPTDRGAEGTDAGSATSRPRRSRPARTDWRLGGRTVYRWRENLLAIALLSLGGAALAGAAIEWFWQSPWAAASATALVWIGMLAPVVWAFTRSRPIGLLRLRPLDVLYAVVLGVLLRTVQGWLDGAGGAALFPSYTRIDGNLPSTWALTELVGPLVVAPVVEEFFFRAIVLIALYTVLRRPLGKLLAGASAVLASTALFVVVHALSGDIDTTQTVSLALLGLVCGLLVMLTGRIWGAVLVHVVYNTSFVVLALVGTVLL